MGVGPRAPSGPSKLETAGTFGAPIIGGITDMLGALWDAQQAEQRKQEMMKQWLGYYNPALPSLTSGLAADTANMQKLNADIMNRLNTGQSAIEQQYLRDTSRILGGIDRANQAADNWQNLERANALKKYEANQQAINQGYQNRYADAMRLLDQRSDQAVRDVYEQYGNLANRAKMDMAARGFSGSTMVPSTLAGITNEQAKQLNRTKDELINQRLGWQTGLSGDALAAQERLFQGNIGLDVGMGQNAINQYLQGQRFRTGIEEGRATGATNLASQNLQNAINWGYDTGSQLNAKLSRQWQAPLDLMKENALVQMGITSQTPLAQFPLAGLGYGVAQGLQDLGGLRGAYRQAAAANPGTNLWDVASIVSLALSPNPSGLVTAAALQGGKYLTR